MSLKKIVIASLKFEVAVLLLVIVPQIAFVAWQFVDDPDIFMPKAQFTLRFSEIGQRPVFPLHMKPDGLDTGLARIDCGPLQTQSAVAGTIIRSSECTARVAHRRTPDLDALFAPKAGWVPAGPWPVVRQPGLDIAKLLPPWWCSLPSILLALWLLRRHAWQDDAARALARPLQSLGWLLLPWASATLVGIAGYFAHAKSQAMMLELKDALAPGGKAGLIVAIVLVAPLLEELVFRGLGWKYLRDGLGLGGTVALSALTFTLLHGGQYDLFGLAMVLAIALSLSWVRERASLLLCIGGHMLANGVSIAALLLA